MSTQISVLALPFLACLILTGIHAYLGIHVLSRKVIFVDIALAQIAALGGTVAFLLGHDPRSRGAYWFSLVFAVLAAAIFALTRTRAERVPQEAVIGLTYAVASAMAILMADISPHGAEHLKDLLAGSIVWVTPEQILRTALLYLVIGAFHFVFRRQFLLISLDPEAAYAQGLRVRLWDFLFYLSFGVVITSSVQIAGVLLVFCYLVAPAVFAFMFSNSLRARLALGWSVGTVVSAVGLYYGYNKPSGPAIMVCFAVALILGGMARAIMTSPRPLRAAGLAVAGVVLTVAAGDAMLRYGSRTDLDGDHRHGEGSEHAAEAALERIEEHDIGASTEDIRLALKDSHPAVRARAVDELASRKDRRSARDIVLALEDSSTAVREHAAAALGVLGETTALPALEAAMRRPGEDEWVRLRAAESVARLGDPSGIPVLLDLAEGAEARLARRSALGTLLTLSGAGGEAPAPSDESGSARLIAGLRRWWEEHGQTAGGAARLRWDAGSATYHPHASPAR